MRYRGNTETPETLHAVIERLAALNNARWIKPYESRQSRERRYNRTYKYVVVSENPYKTDYVSVEPNIAIPLEYSTSYGDWDEVIVRCLRVGLL